MNPHTAYRQSDVAGASPARLVVLLYDQMIQDLTRARHAIELDDIPLRTQLINHAILVIGHLQSPLDFERGGKVAKDLDHFYNVLRQSLVQVQFRPSKLAIDCVITDLFAVRESWLEVERAETIARAEKSPVTAQPAAIAVPNSTAPNNEPLHRDWKI